MPRARSAATAVAASEPGATSETRGRSEAAARAMPISDPIAAWTRVAQSTAPAPSRSAPRRPGARGLLGGAGAMEPRRAAGRAGVGRAAASRSGAGARAFARPRTHRAIARTCEVIRDAVERAARLLARARRQRAVARARPDRGRARRARAGASTPTASASDTRRSRGPAIRTPITAGAVDAHGLQLAPASAAGVDDRAVGRERHDVGELRGVDAARRSRRPRRSARAGSPRRRGSSSRRAGARRAAMTCAQPR